MIRLPLSRLSLLGLAIAVTGCSNQFISTATFNQRLMVKVRPKHPKPEIAANNSDWRFRLIAEAPKEPDQSGDWYLAYQMKDGQPFQEKHSLSLFQLFGWRWHSVHRFTPEVAEAAKQAFGAYPLVVEPSFIFFSKPQATDVKPPDSVPAIKPVSDNTMTSQVDVTGGPNTVWPLGMVSSGTGRLTHSGYDPVWWKGEDYTQLDPARAKVERKIGAHSHVRIGFIDTGFEGGHTAFRQGTKIDDDAHGDADGWAHGKPFASTPGPGTLVPPGRTNEFTPFTETHGLGTLGLLAGGRVRFNGYDPKTREQRVALQSENQTLYLGGAPHSIIVPVRVASNPISLETAAMAYAIDYASRVKHCDVISMSHGGAPTLAWADAVNAAYERGTAMFAAESDWFRTSPEIFATGFGVPLPGPFYPAAFRRVVGVTGATAAQTNYAVSSFWNWFGRPFKPFNIQPWGLRGSYGPDGWSGMSWTPTLREDPLEKDNGKFRAWPIAAYGPNTMWLSHTNEAGLDGSGTSSATPQVAAAAALWLDYNRSQIGRDWNGWRKAEATYQALLGSASRRNEQAPDRYLGAGIVKARQALEPNNDYRSIVSRPEMRRPVAADDFDARKSFKWLLFGTDLNGSDVLKLDQDEIPHKGATQLERMYFNSLLLEKWHRGVLPYIGYQETQLRHAARELAEKQLRQAPSR